MKQCFNILCVSVVILLFCGSVLAEEKDSQQTPANFQTDQLVAWCIVPFDAAERGPNKRAEMAKSLGLKRIAYDWREKHVSEFEAEILAYKKHDIEFFAFWSWHPEIEALIRKHKIKPQIWMTNPSPDGDSQKQRIKAAAEQLLPTIKNANELGCKFGLYNHGGWGGQPKNLVAVCEYLHDKHDLDNVGIVYNFHHAHEDIASFAETMKLIKPRLLCLNLNGMNDDAKPKILPIGDGKHEHAMIQVAIDSGYDGPIGILDHQNEVDAKESLQANIDGLKNLLNRNSDR